MDKWIIISNIFLGVATLFVGVSAIWISLSSKKTKVNTHSGIYTLQPNNEDFYMVFITNKTPNVPIKIDNIGFEKIQQGKNKALWINTLSRSPLNGQFPKIINYGEDIKYFFTKEQIKVILEKSNVKKLNCYFYDTVSNKYLVKIRRSDLEKFISER